jgi:outer membrane protein assembly factor BamB
LLDPYGIYGTRTANRLRAARRRRQSQNAILVLVLLGGLAAGAQLLKMRRVAWLKPDASHELMMPLVTPPLAAHSQKAGGAAFLLASGDGRLLRLATALEESAETTRILDTTFPLHLPLQENERAFVPCEDGKLYAVNWRQGVVLWTYDFHAPLTARPTSATLLVSVSSPKVSAPPGEVATSPSKVGRQVVIAAAGDGVLAALDAGNGKPRWRTKLPSPPGDALSVMPGPTPKVLVPLLGSSFSRGGLWCLDAATGKVLWRFPADARSEASQFAAPAFDAGSNRLFFGSETGALFCLDAQSGTYDTKKKIGWKTFVPPMEKNSEAAVSIPTAPLLFFDDEHSGTSTRLVVGCNDGGVRCLATRDGALLWQFNAEAPIASLQKLRVGERDLVLACGRADALYLLDAQNGAVVKRLASRGKLAGATAVGENVLAVTTDGVVERFSLKF